MVKSRTLTLDTSSDVIAAETRSFLLRNGISEETTESHVKKIMKTLDDYSSRLGKGAQVQFQIRRRFCA